MADLIRVAWRNGFRSDPYQNLSTTRFSRHEPYDYLYMRQVKFLEHDHP